MATKADGRFAQCVVCRSWIKLGDAKRVWYDQGWICSKQCRKRLGKVKHGTQETATKPKHARPEKVVRGHPGLDFSGDASGDAAEDV